MTNGHRATGPVADSSVADVEAACLSASAAGAALSKISARAEALRALAATLNEHRDEAVALAQSETGLAAPRLGGEVDRTVYQLIAFADAVVDGAMFEAIIDTQDPAAAPAPRPDLRRLLVPLGPVAVFAAANFPFAFSVLGGDTASALAAGCPVVVKAHPGHPQLSRFVAELAAEAVGAGVVQLVYGVDAGLALVRNPSIQAVGFTGSAGGAAAIEAVLAERPDRVPFYGELGGLNPVVITERAMADAGESIMRGLVASFTLSAGQFCTKPGLVFVPSGSGAADTVERALRTVEPSPMLTADVQERFVSGLETMLASGVAAVVAPVADDRGVRPAVLRARASELPDAALQECFGPVTILAEYGHLDEVRAALRRLPGSLTTTLHVTEADPVGDLVERCVSLSGRVIFGGWPTGVAVAPAMQHGGPWPATTNPLHTSVGICAARRFLRPVCFQDTPERFLPPELRNANPLQIERTIDGRRGRSPVGPGRAADAQA